MTALLPWDPRSRPVAVIGGGTLGRRIALMFASGGAETRINDVSRDVSADAVTYVEQALPGEHAVTEIQWNHGRARSSNAHKLPIPGCVGGGGSVYELAHRYHLPRRPLGWRVPVHEGRSPHDQ
jgi:hypothetical protein